MAADRTMSAPDTIVAAATPAGRSALAIVRVDGPLAATIANAALGRKTPLAEKTSTLGIWRDGTGAPIDQVVAVLWQAGRSFTGNDSLEITCHGNPLLVRTSPRTASRAAGGSPNPASSRAAPTSPAGST